MFRALKLTYILSMFVAILFSCSQTKYVPEGRYLLKKNIVSVVNGHLDEDEVISVLRQKPNYKTLGLKLKLWAFNTIDSAHVAEKRWRKNRVLREANKERIERQQKINNRRIVRAKRKGKSLYTEKIVQLKDTANPRRFFREWFKYKVGEKPIVFDSLLFNKSLEQLSLYMRNRGYYYSKVDASVTYTKKRKAIVHYFLEPGKQYFIDSVYYLSDNNLLTSYYANFLTKEEDAQLIGRPFDRDYLNEYRDRVARYMRDHTIYGFSGSHINYIADTSRANEGVALGIQFTDRLIRPDFNRDTLIRIKHKETKVRDVYFHISDTTYFKGNFAQKVSDLGLSLLEEQFVRTLDTFYYAEIKKRGTKNIDPFRMATFLYNGKLSVDPDILEIQNYLEHENVYKEYYLERTYTRLLQLGLFQVIKPVITEIQGSGAVDIHYFLVPAQKQSFGFEPRATNSNGFLGVAASINYTNKNLFGGAEKLTLSIGGGFESQPPIFDETLDGEKIKKAGRSFNTFEIGPSVKLDLPGLFPTRVTTLSKRQRPRTVISSAYNYQFRSDFKRQIFQLNYLWRFYVGKTQIFQIGLPGMSIIKFVQIENSADFQNKLDVLNDLFLKNAYSNQFIWQDLKLTFEYNNKEKDDRHGNLLFYMNSTFDPAGNVLSMFKDRQDTTANGQRSIFGVGYSQFARLDNEIIISNPVGKGKSLHAHVQIGAGIPYGNTTTSLPYDYSFYAGGANDNRGWRARALGPGSYKYYLDTNRTSTQIGDLRLGGSLEFRYSLGEIIKGAAFIDAGNVWTMNKDDNRKGSQISNNWYKEIALSAGIGFRLDFDFFIIRLDLGLPITNPSLPNGEKWIFTRQKPKFIEEATAKLGPDYKQYIAKLYTPTFHFGIGYPF